MVCRGIRNCEPTIALRVVSHFLCKSFNSLVIGDDKEVVYTNEYTL